MNPALIFLHKFNFLSADLTNKIQHGVLIGEDCQPGIITERTIKFPKPMSTVPTVVVSIWSGTINVDYSKLSIFVYPITTDSFTLRIANGANMTLTPGMSWIAIAL